ncbi:MAG: CPXCG motif-containing cysteine-rich protein [Limisphaerales bacterium]|nr:CPXCG motif-containing cysteine-rich protein [Verrucomicrobiota bacterium]
MEAQPCGCPYCGAESMIWPDQWEGSSQLISDCENCCRPFSVYLVMDQGQVVELNVEGA